MNTPGRLELTALEGSPSDLPFAPGAVLSRAASVLLGIEIPDPRWGESLALIKRHLQFTRRTVHAGDPVQVAGQTFSRLHVVNSGVFKTVTSARDGREQIVGLHFKGDWIGFDGVATGLCACDAVAMDTGEVWSLRYVALLESAATLPAMMHCAHKAMSRQLARDREWRLALGTLAADARVADFVRYWAESLAERGLRTDQLTLRMTRAEIATYLGMTLETVSRAFTRLARDGLIRFDEKGRREIAIPSVDALAQFVQRSLGPAENLTLQ
jgi:CRP/FNR family transcriptional regulator